MSRPSVPETALRKLSQHYRTYVASWFVRDDRPSDAEVTLMVPLAPKDLDRAARSIPITSTRLAHPISEICVVSPDNAEIRTLCADGGYRWIDELDPLEALCGHDAARAMDGWIRQQMLKLIAPEVTGADRVVAFDSDTFPLRPTRFRDDLGRVILYTGGRTREPYHLFTRLLTGLPPYRGRTFIAHCMLFERDHLAALRAHIEARHGRPWHEVILDLVARPMDEAGVLSEFDIHGTFLSRTMPRHVVTRHRANVKLTEQRFMDDAALRGPAKRFRFASSHIHGEGE